MSSVHTSINKQTLSFIYLIRRGVGAVRRWRCAFGAKGPLGDRGVSPAGAIATTAGGVEGAARPHQAAAQSGGNCPHREPGGVRARPHRRAIRLGAAVQLCAAAHRGHSTALDHV